MPALENVALWHERDISHSSVERVIGPDATITLDFALARLAGIVDKLRRLSRERCSTISTGSAASFNSQRVLLALTQAGMSREDAYEAVQRNAMKAWRRRRRLPRPAQRPTRGDGQADARGSSTRMFDLGYHLKHVDTIFARVFGKA